MKTTVKFLEKKWHKNIKISTIVTRTTIPDFCLFLNLKKNLHCRYFYSEDYVETAFEGEYSYQDDWLDILDSW